MKREEVEKLPDLLFCLIDEDELQTNEDDIKYLWSVLYNPNVYYCEFSESIQYFEGKGTLEKIGGLRIEIRSNEHPPPHFHAVGNGINASFTIEDCTHIKGEIARNDRKKIQSAFKKTKLKKRLIKIWNEMRADGCVVGEIKAK